MQRKASTVFKTLSRPTISRFYLSARFKHALPPFSPHKSFKLTAPPHPEWKLGDGVLLSERTWKDEEKVARKIWDLQTTPPIDAYRLLVSSIIPRPIAFVSSLSASGQPNLAPFSYFTMVAHNPPLICVSFALSQRRPKDTRENILSTREFTVNIISESFAEAANSTSVEAPSDVDEWIIGGLSMAPSNDVKPPIVNESAVSLECELYSFQDIGPSEDKITTTVVFGLIKKVHIRESVLNEDGITVDPAKLRPIARLGGTTYSRVLEGFDLPRVSWK
ncbi:hypothetical protein BDQ17DRAFT_1271484, partial [Cyathus striatus]